jgi:hypothetical protein
MRLVVVGNRRVRASIKPLASGIGPTVLPRASSAELLPTVLQSLRWLWPPTAFVLVRSGTNPIVPEIDAVQRVERETPARRGLAPVANARGA